MNRDIEILVVGKSGAGKTTIAGILHRHLSVLGFEVNTHDEDLNLLSILNQSQRNYAGGFSAKVIIKTKQELK